MSDQKPTVAQMKKEALAHHDERAAQISDWSKKHGDPHHTVRPYETKATPENVQKLIEVVSAAVSVPRPPKDAHILIRVLAYLKSFDFNNIDESATSTAKFGLALSEIDVALTHLKASPEKAIRYLVYRYKMKVHPKDFVVEDFPNILYIEPALTCNIMCAMCYQSDPRLIALIKKMIAEGRPVQMPWDTYKKVIDEGAENGLCAVVFAARGEPTLNPNFTKMLQYAHDKGVLDIKINTNVTKLTEKMVRDWLSIGSPLTIVFSVDAGDKEVYEKIRIGADFDKVVANMQMFNRIRATEFPDSPVRTRISMTVFQEDQDAEAAFRLWGGMVDEFTAKNARSEQSGSIYLDDPSGAKPNVRPEKCCSVMFNRLHVWSDGIVSPCEDDYLVTLVIGDALTQTLKEIWNSPGMNHMRVQHMNGRKNDYSPCNNCKGH